MPTAGTLYLTSTWTKGGTRTLSRVRAWGWGREDGGGDGEGSGGVYKDKASKNGLNIVRSSFVASNNLRKGLFA